MPTTLRDRISSIVAGGPLRADFRISLPLNTTFHRYGSMLQACEEKSTPVLEQDPAAKFAAMSEDEQLAYALSMSLGDSDNINDASKQTSGSKNEVLDPEVDLTATESVVVDDGGELPAGTSTEKNPLIHAIHEDGVAGHVWLNPGTFAKFNMDASKCNDGSSPSFNEWTISFDIKVEELPTLGPMALLSCTTDVVAPPRTVELQLYESGAVSVFDEMPQDPKTFVSPGRWHRVTVRMGQSKEGDSRRMLSVFVNGRLSVCMLRHGLC